MSGSMGLRPGKKKTFENMFYFDHQVVSWLNIPIPYWQNDLCFGIFFKNMISKK
jgi:hypothetical protein